VIEYYKKECGSLEVHGLRTVVKREEYRLRVFKNKVLRRIFGLRKEEITGEWRQLHNEALHNLHSSPNSYYYVITGLMGWDMLHE
jgi:hypothetical protein